MSNYGEFFRQFYQQGLQMSVEGTANTIPSEETINARRQYQELLEKYKTLKSKFKEYKQENQRLKEEISELEDLFKPESKRKKVKRRTENELEKDYGCPYNRCKKEYASTLALNLHIRNKHNGGTKKQRVAYVKKVIEAQGKGLMIPPPDTINLPSEVVEYEIRLFRDRQESENMSDEIKIEDDKSEERLLSCLPSIERKLSS